MLTGGAVILAAGNSRRFGSDKRHYPLLPGRTMLETSLARYQEVFERVFVVLRPDDKAWAHRLTDARIVYAEDAALGMGHSLAAGVKAAQHLDYLFVALADMPLIRGSTLMRLDRRLYGQTSIVQPIYLGRPGHPVGFGSAYFAELKGLTGDVGAKRILDDHQRRIVRISVDDPGTVRDFDVPPG